MKKSPRRSPHERPRQQTRGASFATLAPMGLGDHSQPYLATYPITARKANTSVSPAGVPEEAPAALAVWTNTMHLTLEWGHEIRRPFRVDTTERGVGGSRWLDRRGKEGEAPR